MPLSAIPTELDERIFDYLKRKELSAVSKVSKYYRRIAEPHLYRELRFVGYRNVNAHLLLLTLLSRNDLAVHIKRLAVEKDSPAATDRIRWFGKAHKRMERYLDVLQNLIATIIGSDKSSAGVRIMWLGNVLAHDFIEGTTMLIVCLSSNIVSLSFTAAAQSSDGNGGSFFSKILTEVSSLSPKFEDRFSKLQTLVLECKTHIDLPEIASLQTIKLTGCRKALFLRTRGLIVPAMLHKIEMHGTSGLSFLSTFLHRDRHPHLRTLLVHSMHQSRDFSDRDYQQFVVKLQEECPKLKHLRLSLDNLTGVERSQKLRDLHTLQSLETLQIDKDVLLGPIGQRKLLDSSAILPPNLTELVIGDVDYADIGLLMMEETTADTFTPPRSS